MDIDQETAGGQSTGITGDIGRSGNRGCSGGIRQRIGFVNLIPGTELYQIVTGQTNGSRSSVGGPGRIDVAVSVAAGIVERIGEIIVIIHDSSPLKRFVGLLPADIVQDDMFITIVRIVVAVGRGPRATGGNADRSLIAELVFVETCIGRFHAVIQRRRTGRIGTNGK